MKNSSCKPLDLSERRGRLGVLVGATRFVDAAKEQRFSLDILDLDATPAAPCSIPLNFWGHGVALRPNRGGEAVVLEKRGAGGCTVDLTAREVIRPIFAMEGHAFYGHAAYSPEGNVLFIVETDLITKRGAISIRDADNFAVLSSLPTYGLFPHDCRLVENGRTMVITKGGGPVDSPDLPSVTFVDVNTHALLEKHEMLNPTRNAGHVAVAENREFAMASAPRDGMPPGSSPGGVSLRKQGHPWIQMEEPRSVTSRLFGESLSIAIHRPSRTIAATHPDCGLVTFWSLDRGELIGKLELAGPRGVTVSADEQSYVISYGHEARLLFLATDPIRVIFDPILSDGWFGGAHLYTWVR